MRKGEVWERFLNCTSNTQTWNYFNSDGESGGWQLRRTASKMLHIFPISSAVTLNHFCLAVHWIYSQIKLAKQKLWSHLFQDSITEATAGSNIPSDTTQMMSCSDYKNRACWLHPHIDTAQLSASGMLAMPANKTMAHMEKPTNFQSEGGWGVEGWGGKQAFPLNRLKEESKMETFLIQHKYQDLMVVSRISK